MIFWHLGGSLFLFRWIFRDPDVDVRFLLLGAVLPDLIDLPLGTVILGLSTGELWFHTLAVAGMVLVVSIVVTDRTGPWRKRLVALSVGLFLHLLLDGMWTSTEAFLWPFAGWDFPSGPSPYWAGAWDRALGDPIRWLQELAGLVYLVWVWRSSGLASPDRRAALLSTGRLPGRIHG